MFRQLGIINFLDLGRYIWKAANFDLFQTYLLDHLFTISLENRTFGLISGGGVTVNAALTLDIAEGIVLFPTGELVQFDASQVTMDVADGGDPRIDLIELLFSEEDGTTVTNIDAADKILDKLLTATPTKKTGAPAGGPSAPAKTANAVILSHISVAAGQTVLVDPDDISVLPSDTEYSEPIIGRDFEVTIENAVGPVNVPGLLFDKTKITYARVTVYLNRRVDGDFKREGGVLSAIYDADNDDWDVKFNSDHGDAGVLFTILASGQVKYKSNNLAGANYSGKMIYQNIIKLAP